jgi:preprotein translocase subunit SecA
LWAFVRDTPAGVLDNLEIREVMAKSSDFDAERFREKERRDKRYRDQLPGPDDEPLPPPIDPIRSEEKPKRNDPCPCGSGKKYKHCCGKQGA